MNWTTFAGSAKSELSQTNGTTGKTHTHTNTHVHTWSSTAEQVLYFGRKKNIF